MENSDIFYRLTQAVIDMDATRAAEAAAAVIQHNVDPYEAIIEGLAKGMDKVNELFENEEYFVPEILLCADAMNAAEAVKVAKGLFQEIHIPLILKTPELVSVRRRQEGVR